MANILNKIKSIYFSFFPNKPHKLAKKVYGVHPYSFDDEDLLKQAFTHTSAIDYETQTKVDSYERLEFLGDAVLGLLVGHILMDHFPNHNEGLLTRMRANLVNETHLARIARQIDIGSYIKLGKGEIQTNGRNKDSILADTFEALIASVYLDGGLDAAFECVKSLFEPWLSDGDTDYKSQLQEKAQKNNEARPRYHVIEEIGPDHNKTFKVNVKACDIIAEGIGKNKKSAQQAAAKKAIEVLSNNSSSDSRL